MVQSFLQWTQDRILEVRRRPMTDYYFILIILALLTGLGVVMVLSSSMAQAVLEGASVWSTATRQTVMVCLGLAAMWFAMRVSPATIRRYSFPMLLFSMVLLLAVHTPLGTGAEEVGSQSWIVVGPIRFQPSEIARVTFAIWGAGFLADRSVRSTQWWNHFTQFMVVALIITMLIIAEGDLGMAMAFLIVVAALMFFSGFDLRWLYAAGIVVIVGMVAVALGGGFRSHRITVYMDALLGHFDDTRGVAYQSYQGFLSLADGSLFGVGLGQSRAKWFYLPEAKNDFIFAVIGEELGFFGAGIVIVLFAGLGVFGLRTARRSANQYLSLMAATITTSVVVQAFINIGYVVGALPVTGIQLPMISAGGTSAVITLAAMGVLISCARHEPEAVSAMQSYGRPRLDQLLFLSEPSLQVVEAQSRALRGHHVATQARQQQRVASQPAQPRRVRPTTARYQSGAVRNGSLESRQQRRNSSSAPGDYRQRKYRRGDGSPRR